MFSRLVTSFRLLYQRCDSLNELRLADGVGDAIIWMRGRRVALEMLLGTGDIRVGNQIVAKEKALPVLLECPRLVTMWT
jgi:hypothetical protein